MEILGIMGYWWLLAASLAVFLIAAKTHGRQIRLERELEGHPEVDFRKENHPFVEALWRRDRIRFWIRAGLLGSFFILGLSMWAAARLRMPGFEGEPGLGQLLAATFLAVVLWAPTIAFVVNAFQSQAFLRRALFRPAQAGGPTRGELVAKARPEWLHAARRGTLTWLGLSILGMLTIIGIVAAGV